MQLDNIKIHTVTLNNHYRVLRYLAFFGWIAMLVLLGLYISRPIPLRIKLICAAIFSGVIIAGITQYGPRMFSKIVRKFASDNTITFINTHLTSAVVNPALHLAFHYLLTLYLIHHKKALQLTTMRIIALNAAIAIGIESTQLGIPGRSADVVDIMIALLGSVACIVGLHSAQLVVKRK